MAQRSVNIFIDNLMSQGRTTLRSPGRRRRFFPDQQLGAGGGFQRFRDRC